MAINNTKMYTFFTIYFPIKQIDIIVDAVEFLKHLDGNQLSLNEKLTLKPPDLSGRTITFLVASSDAEDDGRFCGVVNVG